MGEFQLFPEAASVGATQVDHLYWFLCAVGIVFTALIFLCVFIFAIKYRRKSEDEIPHHVEGSMKLEIVWSVIPFLIMLVMFFWGAKVYFTNYTPPPNALDIYVTGKQWMWKVQYPGGQREINELHVPINRPVKLTLASEDVIHSFYVPAFRLKRDVVPGRFNTEWFTATKPGRYHLFCAEYCGTEHSGMIGWVTVMEPADYQNWLAGGGATGSMAQQGSQLFQQLGCSTCHLQDEQGRCPILKGVYGSRVLLDDGRTVLADDAYVRESILNPNAKIVAGFKPDIMPTFQGQVSEEQLLQLIVYVKSLAVKPNSPMSAAQTGSSEGMHRTGGVNAPPQAAGGNEITTQPARESAFQQIHRRMTKPEGKPEEKK